MEGNQHHSLECRNFDSNVLSTAPESGFVKEEKESDFDSNEFSIAPVLSKGLFMTEVLPYKDYFNATVKKEPCSVSSNSTQMCDKQTVICSPDGHLLEYSDVLSETIDDNLEKTNQEENITKFLVKEYSEHVTVGGELFPTLKDLLGENKSTSLKDNCTSKPSKIKTNNDLNNYSPINSCSEFSEFEQPIPNNYTNINLKESKRNSTSPSKLKKKLKKLKKRSRKLGNLKDKINNLGVSKVHCKSKKNKSTLKKLKRKIEILPNETKIKSVVSLKPRSIRRSDFQKVRKKVKEKNNHCEDLFSCNLTERIDFHKDNTLLSDSSIQDIENKPKSKNISRLRLENSEVLLKDKFQLQLSPPLKDIDVEIKGNSSSTMGANKYPTRTKNSLLRATSRSKSRSVSPRRRPVSPRRGFISPRRRPVSPRRPFYPKRRIKSRSRSITPKILIKRSRRSNSRLGRCRSRSLSPQQRFIRRYRCRSSSRRSDSRCRWKERYKSRSSSRGSRSSSRKSRSLSRHRRRKTSSRSRSSPRYRSRSNSQRSWSSLYRKRTPRRSSSFSPKTKSKPLKNSKLNRKKRKKLTSKFRELFSPTKNKSGRHSSSMSISPESPRKVNTIVETYEAVLNAPSNKIETISSSAPIKLPSSSKYTHFQNAVVSQSEQMLKPHFHQFPLTVRETDVLPTQLVIPQTSLAPILVNTFQPPPARCMPPNQPSTFITSQQHQMVDTSLPPPSHLSNFNAFHMGASHINIGNINVQHEFNLFPNITQSHCLQGQSRSYQNYYQSEKDAYFDEKHCIISTIKSPPLPSCPPPPLPPPPPPPPQPSPPPLQLGHTAKNADTSSVSNIEVKITSSRTSSLLEQNKSDNILKITPSGTSPSLLEHHKSDRISTLWSKLGPVLSSHFKINDIVAEQETHFTAIMKPQVPIDKIKQVNSNFNKAELNLKDNNKQTHRENTDTSRVCMKKTLNKSFTIFQNKINKGQENVTNQTISKNTKTHRFSTENLDNLIDHKSNNISKYENPILEDIHKKTCAVADSSLNNNTNVLKNEGSKPNYLSSAQEAKPLTHTFPSVLTTDQSTKLNAYSSTEVNENKDPPIENTINTDMLTHSSKQADTGSIANQTSDKAGNEMATNTKSIQISETLKSSSKYKEISEGKNASITDLPMKEEMGNLYKKSALHNIQINNSERTNTHSSDITHDCIDKISLMSVPTDVRQVTKDKLQIDTENTSKNISTKMYQTNPGKLTKHENNGASKRKSRPPSKFTLYCKPTVEISHSNTKDIGKETLKQQPATIHSQEKKSDLKDNNSTSRPANINYSNILEVDQSGVKISHTKNTSSKRSLSCFQYLPTHLFPNNPLLNISKGGIALKNKYKEARKHKLEYPDIKLGSIPYIKLKVIKNIHDEKREIERILSIRKSKECVSVNENKDSSLTYSASNTRHGKSLSVMHILNHMIADLTVKRRTVATQVTGKKNKLSGLVEVQPIGDSVTYPEWLKQAMEIVSKQSVICDEVIKLL